MKLFKSEKRASDEARAQAKYPGIRDAVDGNTAVIHVEREASDAAGAYPIRMKPIRVLFLSLLLSPALSWALEVVPYRADSFARARAAGKVTALQFHSGWCPICVMQERGVRALAEDKDMREVVVFQADFTREEALRKRFGVHSFSTLVIFRGEEERARTTGDFRPEQLKQHFAKAL